MGYIGARYDLNKCYRFNEYNEAIAYAKKNMEIEGVREQYQKLLAEKDNYVQDIKGITEPEKENEDKKYTDWGNWIRKKNLCVRITIGFVIMTVINMVLGGVLPFALHTLIMKLSLFLFILIPASAVTKVGQIISERAYYKYMEPIGNRIRIRNNNFAEYARACNQTIDDLFLMSLEPAHREMVMMRREQAKQHEEMMRMEKERLKLEKERIRIEKERQVDARNANEEARRTREAQERLLRIEEDREIRYKCR
ncbi:MAG: hypothetical protein K2H37_03495 [Lachnospiraceae bacterium]|nr:hypothetical protein [Lachnospiraceae bacterium]